MSLLTTHEALLVSDTFLLTLYGDETFQRWKKLKSDLEFVTEQEYVNWLIDVAYHYKTDAGYYQDGNAAVDNANPDTKTGITQSVSAEQMLDNESDQQVAHVNVDVDGSVTHGDVGFLCDPALSRVRTVDLAPPCVGYSDINGMKQSVVDGQRQTSSVTAVVSDVKHEHLQDEDIDRQQEHIMEDGPDIFNTNTEDPITLSSDEYDAETIDTADGSDTGHMSGLPPLVSGEVPDQPAPAAPSKRHQCPHCPYSSNTQSHLRRHVVAVHLGHRPYSCHYCSYSGSQKERLKAHLISRHGLSSDFQCGVCGKNFAAPAFLRNHERSCGRAGGGSGNMRR